MSVFAAHHKNRPTVVSQIDAMDAAKTVYAGELVWYKLNSTEVLAVRLISINLEESRVELEVTATGSNLYRRGERLFGIPFTRVVKRTRWDTPRFSLRWIDYPTAKERASSEFVRLTALVNRQAWNK
jgi:hypothetical protein